MKRHRDFDASVRVRISVYAVIALYARRSMNREKPSPEPRMFIPVILSKDCTRERSSTCSVYRHPATRRQGPPWYVRAPARRDQPMEMPNTKGGTQVPSQLARARCTLRRSCFTGAG